MTTDDGFLSRWSRRKSVARGGEAAVDVAPPAPVAKGSIGPVAAPLATSASAGAAAPVSPATEAPPLPTLDDVARLTRASDYSPYLGRDVDAGVRNAAMRKLFSDPHFNVMDGLDTYIDDYGRADPIPPAMLRRMNQSAALGLFSDETVPGLAPDMPPAPPAEAIPDGADLPGVAQSALSVSQPAVPESPADDDPDLRLQQDDADRRADTGPDPRA